jgi:4,5-dihydroxyphthalate decarboxylase
MSDLALRIACNRYDHVQALFDGRVRVDGVDATFEAAGLVSEIFENMVRHRAYDVAELGLTFYLRTLDLPDPPFVAIPVFPNRHFRHSAIWVNTASGIEGPEDLIGRTIGEFATYGHDAGIWPKGILADDHGVTPEQSRWVVGGTDWYTQPHDFVPFLHPADVDVTVTPKGTMLGPMLEAGEIDALVSAIVPRCVLDGSPRVAPLFRDSEAVERDYFRRTGIYPIMHTVVVQRDLVERHPGVASAVYRAFCASRDMALQPYRDDRMGQHSNWMIPWLTPLYEDNRRLLGDDYWAYGVEANRTTIDTFLRYSFEQGLSRRRLTCEDIFLPELLDT